MAKSRKDNKGRVLLKGKANVVQMEEKILRNKPGRNGNGQAKNQTFNDIFAMELNPLRHSYLLHIVAYRKSITNLVEVY